MVDVKGVIQNIGKNFSNIQFSRRINYTKAYEKNKVKDNIVLYESFHGKAMNDNPFAIFKSLISNKSYKHLTHIWVLEETEGNEYVKYYSKLGNVKFVKPHTKEYFYYLTSAKYLIHNVTLPPYFIRKDNQIYINTWHGTPLKTLGNDMVGFVSQNYNVQRNFLQSNYILSPNNFTTDKLIRSYGLDGIYKGSVIENGYPRIDSIFNDSPVVESFLKRNNVDLNKKIILYAPTWRGQTGSVQDTSQELIDRIEKIITQTDTKNNQLLVKVHPLVFQFIENFNIENVTFIPDWVDANELLYYTDVLITDYSSIFFDYLVTDKPIIFYTYDRDEYVESRGVYFDLHHLPGEICLTEDEVAHAINHSDNIIQKNMGIIREFKDKFTPYDHGNVTSSYIQRIFEDNQLLNLNELKFDNKKENIILYGGALLNNGITSSVINLSKNLDYSKYNLIIIDKNSTNPQFDENIKKLSPHTFVLFRGGGINLTYTEWVKYNRIFNKSIVSEIEDHKKYVAREWRRLIGDVKPDIVIDFGGYAPFWSYMMAFSNARRKIIYQHNDMKKESEKVVAGRYVHKKNLSIIFQLYKYFDFVASVGKLTKEQNESNLSDFVSDKKFVYVPNLLDKDYLFEHRRKPQTYIGNVLGSEKLIVEDDDEFGLKRVVGITPPIKTAKNFINIGRLSPEKDQEKLLRVFRSILDETKMPHQLYLVGSGLDEMKLKALTKGLNIEKNVIFVGQSSSAMELLDMCDCFVFSSNHEGQPMTLLECLALNKPIIATDIPGNRSVLGDDKGIIVPNNFEGLKDGILSYLSGKKIPTGLDVDLYNRDALERLYKLFD